MTIKYVTNLDVNDHAGGWSGMNYHIYHELKKRFSISLVQNINPVYPFLSSVLSKLQRVVGAKRIFPAYTENRLNKIKDEVEQSIGERYDYTFFHGATPWLNVATNGPYGIYVDACFSTYLQVYHSHQSFNDKQVNELFEKEATFMIGADAVFFSSNWALEETKRVYKLSGHNFYAVGLGGGLTTIVSPPNLSDPYFLFVALDFKGKGGHIVTEAFIKTKKQFPQYHLRIVGDKPPRACLRDENIHYEGFINKNTREGKEKMSSLFQNAYCFLLPTSKDLTPLVLVEAASAGCPAISTRKFGISEIVINNDTGVLLSRDDSMVESLEKEMKRMCSNLIERDRMGEKAKMHVSNNFTWDVVGKRIANIINRSDKRQLLNA